MSSTKGRLRRAGAAKASGLVPSTGAAPRVGTITTVRAELATMPSTPRSVAKRA
jgi:hypothetical protein